MSKTLGGIGIHDYIATHDIRPTDESGEFGDFIKEVTRKPKDGTIMQVVLDDGWWHEYKMVFSEWEYIGIALGVIDEN